MSVALVLNVLRMKLSVMLGHRTEKGGDGRTGEGNHKTTPYHGIYKDHEIFDI